MIFIVLFEDADGKEHLRQAHMADHLTFLAANADKITAAGPLFTSNGDGRGGMWSVKAEDAEAVEELVRADPFYPTGLRKTCTVLEWRQVFRDGARVTR
ncbi:YciI family protein [Roseovarius rhodophyticola]|uniref:YciI family protein n=1 Tax=Roseovarius rhodophyticola TaxID=3080827 RepID=A0ABZ2TJ24_9RHOB|nr:YciI family protein [Roseovarius sp. W115]MDV2928686.1 YciI family protein [Roseovarius sp. W115]